LVLAPILLLAGLGIGLFIFKDKIADFFSLGFASAGKDLDQFGKDVQTNIGQIGKDIDQFGKDQQKAFDDFVRETQQGIDKSITGTQEGINKFFTDAQANFDANIAGINAGIDTQGKAIDQFGKDVQTNIATSVSGIQQGFDDFGKGVDQIISNAFGGQKNPKEITKKVNTMTLNKDVDRRKFLKTTDAGEHTGLFSVGGKPDILIMKNRPLVIGAIKPSVQNITTPTVSKFLQTNPSNKQQDQTTMKNIEEKIPMTTKRATRFSR